MELSFEPSKLKTVWWQFFVLKKFIRTGNYELLKNSSIFSRYIVQLTITICIICKLKSQGSLGRGTQRRFPSKYVENTFQTVQSSFRSQEIHSKRRYKIGFCLVILGDFASCRNYKGFRIIFPKILDAIYPFTNVKIFLIPLSITSFESESLRFRFSTKNSIFLGEWNVANWASENRRVFIRKVSKIVHEWNGYREIFSRPQVIENSRQYLLLRKDILQKTVVGCPWSGLWIRHWMIEIYNGTSIRINISYQEY